MRLTLADLSENAFVNILINMKIGQASCGSNIKNKTRKLIHRSIVTGTDGGIGLNASQEGPFMGSTNSHLQNDFTRLSVKRCLLKSTHVPLRRNKIKCS
jgi:hypothetical protein